MSAGNIDDILARIQRLESAAGGRPDPEPTPGPAPERPAESDATHEPEDPTDDADILTPETYADPEPSSDAVPTSEAADVGHTESSEDESDLFAPEVPEAAHEEPSEADEAMASIEPDAMEPIHPDAMASVEPAEPAEPAEPVSPEPSVEPQDSGPDGPGQWFIGRQGLRPRSGSLEEITPDAEADEPPASGSGGAGDGMVSVNPGGAGSAGMSDLFTPDSKSLGSVNRSLADHLADVGISRELVTAAERVAASTPGKDIAVVLIEQGADEIAIQSAVARHHDLPFERIDAGLGLDGAFDGAMLQRLGLPFCAEHAIVPLRMDGKRAIIASARPDIAFELDEIRRRLNCGTPKVVLTTNDDIKAALESAGYGTEERAEQEQVDLNAILEEVDENDVTVEKNEDQTVDLEQKAGESPVIRYVNYIIQTAVKEGASDIHIEPAEKKITVRLRIDGVLYESMHPPANMAAAITSRIKIMANLDISERRIPQDGRIRATVQGRKLDLRVSTLPCGYGEKVVMRILDTKSINVQLEDLGFDENTLEIWKHQVKQPHGIVLVTGPTGSGKTTTLYSSLRQLDKNKLNISTAEDPIEYHLEGITQTQTHEKIGMTFSKVLKALLRQDPDVIMLGEIRDMETAHIAVQAALTGHLVLSTLHTNDAPSSVTRLVNIGLEPFLVGAAVNAVLAQRLVRRLCKHCKELRDPPPEQIEFLELSGIIGQQIYQPVGCDKCRQGGYSGRVGIYELLAVDDQLRDVIARNPNVSEFRRMCLERGMQSLRQDGMGKVAEGLTTVAEVLRVTTEH